MKLNLIIEQSLNQMGVFLLSSEWFGRENEVVNLFAHKFLLQNFDGKILKYPTQLGIEVAVKQIELASSRKKQLVRKDLVIWPVEYQTVWRIGNKPENIPLAIIEWKVDDVKKCKYDIDWLVNFTKAYPGVIGYSVCAFIKNKRGISFKRVENGKMV